MQFERIYEKLKDSYNVVAFDVYGCGENVKPDDWEAYSTEELLQDNCAIVQKYKTAVNFIVGHRYAYHFLSIILYFC